jgi:hypothetical protein
MRYYVVSDVHGFYTPLRVALETAGFFQDEQPHKLIVCGDLLDRGREAIQVQNFACDLLKKDKLIYIRGNHEDLMGSMFFDLRADPELFAWGVSHHISNGTYDSAVQLAGLDRATAWKDPDSLIDGVKNSDFWTTLLPLSVNFYETPHYVFVHGWIPCSSSNKRGKSCRKYNPGWRMAPNDEWLSARWINGMEAAEEHRIIEPGKIIVCGHWHASFGHSRYEQRGGEFNHRADFTPYYGHGVIGIDGCTAHTNVVNCVVIDD